MSMIQMKPKDNLGMIARCFDPEQMGNNNTLNVTAQELMTVTSKYIDFNDYDTLEDIQSLLEAMEIAGLHLVSSDGERVFRSKNQAEIVHGINEYLQSDFQTTLGNQILYYDLVCLTRSCNLRYKVIEIIGDDNI